MKTSISFLLLVGLFSVLSGLPAVAEEDIESLEQRLAAMAPGAFDYHLHEKLRAAYLQKKDLRRSMQHVEAILSQSPFDQYMRYCLVRDTDDIRNHFLSVAKDHDEWPHLAAMCWVWAGEMAPHFDARHACFSKARATRGLSPLAHNLLEDRWWRLVRPDRAWPKTAAPAGMETVPGPWNDPVDLTVWPNQTSRANSDSWLVQNHDRVREMRPRVLLINFSNEHSHQHLGTLSTNIIRALRESSRFHGYRSTNAPAFLNYDVLKFVDLRDPDRQVGNSRRTPVKDPAATEGFNMRYREYFSEEFAEAYGIRDPEDPRRFLTLEELVDGGYVHEVWFFLSGRVPERPRVGAYEFVEMKPGYTKSFGRKRDTWVHTGNGFDRDQPWTGRTVRIGFINASRGVGCFMESLSHGFERMAYYDPIPYLTPYLKEYIGFDLRERHGVPFHSLYEVDLKGKGWQVHYPDEKTMVAKVRGKEFRISPYAAVGGNVHFPPNGRGHYDIRNPEPVLTIMQDWRDGRNAAPKPYTYHVHRPYFEVAPDCTGAWLIYWRQNMPGLDNDKFDDADKPMKNWWPFLFY